MMRLNRSGLGGTNWFCLVSWCANPHYSIYFSVLKHGAYYCICGSICICGPCIYAVLYVVILHMDQKGDPLNILKVHVWPI